MTVRIACQVAVPLLAVSLLAACAARPNWTQKGVTEAQTERDWNECRRMSEQDAGISWDREQDDGRSSSAAGALRDYDRREAARRSRQGEDACMRSRGYFPKRHEN